jgi:hypothetical protein
VYEYDYFQETEESLPSTVATFGNPAGNDDELLAGSIEPSPVPMVAPMGAPEDDELIGATTSELETNASLKAPFPRSISPSFGFHMTYKYDYMGNYEEISCPNPPMGNISVKSLPPPIRPISIYPLEEEITPSNINGTCKKRVMDEMLLPIIYERNKTGFETTKEFDSSVGVLVAGRYRITGFLGSAAFSKAVKAVDLVNRRGDEERHVCLKIIKNDKDFFDQSLDEVKVLSLINRAVNVDEKKLLRFHDWFYYKEHLILVTELLRENLYEFSKFVRNPANEQPRYFTIGVLQRIAYQLLVGIEAVHSLGLIHCDLKPENVLFKSFTDVDVRIIDFGSSCLDAIGLLK